MFKHTILKTNCACLLLLSLLAKPATAQLDSRAAAAETDTVKTVQHEEVTVVTATRTERKLANTIVPVTLIGQKQIAQSGVVRLNEILQEQTGLFITGGTGRTAVGGGVFGNGLQLQGLSPDHTLILIDGEPVIGRQGGTLDLSRFTTGNIKKIEIIYGPSSSLYGSEAMGGVVNIITEAAKGDRIGAQLRYGSFQTTDAQLQIQAAGEKNSLFVFANRNSGQGYDLDKNTIEKTADPYYSYTAQTKWQHRFSEKSRLTLNARYFHSLQESDYAVNSSKINIAGNGQTDDGLYTAAYDHRFAKNLSVSFRLMGSHYRFSQQLDSLENNHVYYADRFAQTLLRAENLAEYQFARNHTLTFGGGFSHITVNTTRYAGEKTQRAAHGFAQHEWTPQREWQLVSGLRYDYNTAYRASLSPKLGLRYQPTSKLTLRFSAGRGFKAPDFRQLYLNFVNNAAEGYTLYGASAFSLTELQNQLNAGLLAQILPQAYTIKALLPETAVGLNLGGEYNLNRNTRISLNLFRNDIRNLVNYVPVAQKPNGSNVFSYVNLNSAFTQGLVTDITLRFGKMITLQAGYQYLQTADKDIYRDIKAGKIYGRDYAGGPARLLTRKDYGGLNNRSKHMAHAKLFFNNEAKGFDASLRAIYRSRWGVYDNDGNGFANQDGEYAKGFVQLNMAVSKKLGRCWQVQTGVNNLLDYTDAVVLPNLPGRNGFMAFVYSFKK